MEINKLEVGDKFYSQDNSVRIKITRIFCEYNPELGRWETSVECESHILNGGTSLKVWKAWEFIERIRDEKYQSPGNFKIIGENIGEEPSYPRFLGRGGWTPPYTQPLCLPLPWKSDYKRELKLTDLLEK
jgi:hypothetical protein